MTNGEARSRGSLPIPARLGTMAKASLFPSHRALAGTYMTFAAYLLTAISALLIDYGWQPLAEGGHEYIIQVPEELIATLAKQEIQSYVPPDVRDIRRIRIKFGTEQLPQITESTTPESDNAVVSAAEVTATELRTAKYPGDSSETADAPASAASDNERNNLAGSFELFGLDALTLTEIGLGIAAAIILFLIWSHASMRRRYRALLHRVHDRTAA